MLATLVITYRKRKNNLLSLIEYLNYYKEELKYDFKVLIIESDQKPSLNETIFNEEFINYKFIEDSGTFHKTKLLNIALHNCNTKFIIPYDCDLIPINNSLANQLKIANLNSKILISGYRIMSPDEKCNIPIEAIALQKCTMPEEDNLKSLKYYLLDKERFGISPFFRTKTLLKIGGWNEKFVGWGAEDQELIERYLEKDRFLLRSPDIVYLHLNHSHENYWKNSKLTGVNRELYYKLKNEN